jgi:hypothetical protein
MGAAFAVGLAIGKGKKREQPPAGELPKVEAERPKARDESVLIASLERFRKALGDREKQVGELKAELDEVRAKLPPALASEEESEFKKWEERRKERERQRTLEEKSKPLKDKILQRKDKALRAEGLDELAGLLLADDREKSLVGLEVLRSIGSIKCDKERFEPYALKALNNADGEVRRSALRCLEALFTPEQRADLLIPMAKDPSPEVRRMAAESLSSIHVENRSEEIVSALRPLLKDDDWRVRGQAMDGLWSRGGPTEELEEVALQLAKRPPGWENEQEVANRIYGLSVKATQSAKLAQRLVEMHDERDDVSRFTFLLCIWNDAGSLSSDVKPIATQFCTRLLKESTDPDDRSAALQILPMLGGVSVLPQLEELAGSPDAEGIEERLAQMIEGLRQRESEER